VAAVDGPDPRPWRRAALACRVRMGVGAARRRAGRLRRRPDAGGAFGRVASAVHDRLLHLADELGHDGTVYDEACTTCLAADHAGRVDPPIYDDADEGLCSSYPGSGSWLDTHDEWVRVRPTLREALQAVEDSANARLVSFVADAGSAVLRIRPPADWEDGKPRCSVGFAFAAAEDDPR